MINRSDRSRNVPRNGPMPSPSFRSRNRGVWGGVCVRATQVERWPRSPNRSGLKAPQNDPPVPPGTKASRP